MTTNHEQSGNAAELHHAPKRDATSPYLTLVLELAADFVVMFFVMYGMIATFDHLYFNVGNVYMTLMMVAPMALLMLVFMRHMFRSKSWNLMVVAAAIAVFAIGWFGMRTQAGVGDAQFVRSMIPHHSGAILMCREAKLTDPELIELCRDIIKAQEREIGEMTQILERL
ncbi:MAG: DUF305 domain-containing protein [Sphingomonadaceae bacterium]|nr:DUF305 domain-containing protein [Sphingomonadaceae bacterium]